MRWAVLLLSAACGLTGQVRPGVWTGRDLGALPLPVSGYDIYMMGEMHGIEENVEAFRQYIVKLSRAAGLRDVALEEKPAWQNEAQAYIDGASRTLPEALCLRAEVLTMLRNLNLGREPRQRLRVHLVDIDLDPESIRKHLSDLQNAIPRARGVALPEAGEIRDAGLTSAGVLRRLTKNPEHLAGLRTVEHSIRCLQQGLEVGRTGFKGSPYLDDREEAIRSNLADVARLAGRRPVLALYGNDHVSKTLLHNGGPRQDGDFAPAAMRLGRSGLRVFSLVTLPLTGQWSWRGRQAAMLWTAADGHLSNGETFDHLLAANPGAASIYIDAGTERAQLPSQDITNSGADAFILYARGTPSTNFCPAR